MCIQCRVLITFACELSISVCILTHFYNVERERVVLTELSTHFRELCGHYIVR